MLRTVAALTLVALAHTASGLLFERVRIIDHVTPKGQVTPNYFFRSDVPAIKNATTGSYTFEHATLMKYFAARAREANLPWTDDVTLVDINTLNSNFGYEAADLAAEQMWFEHHAAAGSFFNWVILGSLRDPTSMPAAEIRRLIGEYASSDADQLAVRIPSIRSGLLQGMGGRPLVVFVHCWGGIDRTGEFSGAYKMAFGNWTLKQAQQWNTEVAGRQIHAFKRNGLIWFCWYLTYAQRYEGLNCSDYGA